MARVDNQGKGHIKMVLLTTCQCGPAYRGILGERLRQLKATVLTLPACRRSVFRLCWQEKKRVQLPLGAASSLPR